MIIYGDNPSHWLSYFSRWLKPPTRLFLCFFCGFYPFLQSIALKVIIAWTKFLVMSCETWLGNPGSMAGEWNGHFSMGNERYERQTMFDYHEAKPQKDTKKHGSETSRARKISVESGGPTRILFSNMAFIFHNPLGPCMVYMLTFGVYYGILMVNVTIYSIHGSYG